MRCSFKLLKKSASRPMLHRNVAVHNSYFRINLLSALNRYRRVVSTAPC